jgi:hypothetical protein
VTASTAVPRPGFVSDPQDFAGQGPAAAQVAALYPNLTHVRVENRGSPLTADRDAFLYERPVLNVCNGVWANALSVPPEQYLAGGVTRSLARRAFADRLPPQTANEMRKGYQGADWFEGLDADRAGLADEIAHIGRDTLAARLIDLPRARALLADWPVGAQWRRDDQVMLYRHALLRGVSTGNFLRKVSGVN